MKIFLLGAGLATALILFPSSSLAGQVEDGPSSIRIDGPPPPVAPAMISRDEKGNATVRAFRVTEPIRLDGRLDEAEYRDVQPITGFYQSLPQDGAPASETTEAWVMFDDENVYVSARLYESAPPSEWIANEMRRDTQQLRNNDTFTAQLDTYYDRRNGVLFYTNLLGARADQQFTNEANPNADWNPIWDVRTGRFEGGWVVEMQIPFKSLRYKPGRDQVWGIQLRRAIRRKNEWVHLTPVPRSQVGSGSSGIFRSSRDATLIGIEAPDAGANLEIKPYVIAGMETDRAATPPRSNDGHQDAGLDLKYGVTQNLTADFTVNTDFAQVEADEQQVNLTRFEVTFPEKREFFLEGRGVYQFGLSGGGGGGGNAPSVFFSRRIGLEGRNLVPIIAGGRLTGKVGSFDLGALSIQTGDDEFAGTESTNFTVLRVRRDILNRSSIGALFTNRSISTVADGSNQAFGVDGTFSFFQDVSLSGFFAKTQTAGLNDDDLSYTANFGYAGDLWGVTAGHLRVGENFNPEIGFVRRRGFRQSTASARISPRPASDLIRRVSLQTSVDYLELAPGHLVGDRTLQGQFQLEFESSDALNVNVNHEYELLEGSFRIAPGVMVPAGRYRYRDAEVSFSFGLQRWYSGSVSVQHGTFYDGHKTTTALRTGRINVSDRLSLEPTLSFNSVDLPWGSFHTNLAVTRINYAFSPRMFFGGLVQYNSGSHALSSNLRLRWEYRPGSEIFVVYTDARNTDVLDRWSDLVNRGLTVKMNYLWRP